MVPSSSPSGIFVEGTIPSLAPWKSRRKVGIIVGDSAQWSWIAEGLGFGVSWIHHPDPSKLPRWLQAVFPDTFFTSKALALTSVDVILCDGPYPKWLREWTLAPLVVGTRNCNRFGHVWQKTSTLRHASLGGLTDTSVKVHGLSNVRWPFDAPAAAVFLDTSVYTVASDTTPVGRTARKPLVRLLHPPVVSPLGRNVYHGGGLYPTECGPIRNSSFLRSSTEVGGVVGRFVRKKSGWSMMCHTV